MFVKIKFNIKANKEMRKYFEEFCKAPITRVYLCSSSVPIVPGGSIDNRIDLGGNFFVRLTNVEQVIFSKMAKMVTGQYIALELQRPNGKWYICVNNSKFIYEPNKDYQLDATLDTTQKIDKSNPLSKERAKLTINRGLQIQEAAEDTPLLNKQGDGGCRLM